MVERGRAYGEWDNDPEDFDSPWVDCDACGGFGVIGHDCGEDTCCCANPFDNIPCAQCDGRGGYPPPEHKREDSKDA